MRRLYFHYGFNIWFDKIRLHYFFIVDMLFHYFFLEAMDAFFDVAEGFFEEDETTDG